MTSTANITELEDLARSSPRQHPRARFDTMDSLRAIGALTVLITHVLLYFPDATGLAAAKVKHLGYDSLAIFFFISGFALYRPSVVSRIEGMPVVRIRAFCVRRVFRLFPLFWVAMTLVAIYPGPRGAFTADQWRYYGLVQSWNPRTIYGGVAAAWTLSIEAALYVFLAALLLLLRVASKRRSWCVGYELRVIWVLWSGVAILTATLNALDLRVGPPLSVLYNWVGPVTWFLMGMSFAVFSVSKGPVATKLLESWNRSATVWWGVLLALSVPWSLLRPQDFNPQATVVGCLLAASGLFAGSATLIGRVLRNKRLTFLGLLSYGIYLWHKAVTEYLYSDVVDSVPPPLDMAVVLLITLALSVSLAYLTYRFVERPAMRVSSRLARRLSRQLLTECVAPVT